MKIAVIGGGMMAQVGHIPFLANDPRCSMVAIAESRPSLMTALAAHYPATRLVADHAEVLADPSIEAVFISAPRPATGPLVLQALEAGKHVLSEKPMAHSYDQGKILVDAAQQRGLQYHLGFMKRYDAGIQAAHAALNQARADGSLGALLTARFWNFSAEYAVPPPAHTRPSESRSVRFPMWATAPDWLTDPAMAASYAWFMNANSHDINLMRYMLGNDLEIVNAMRSAGDGICALIRAGDLAVSFETARTAAGHWVEGAEFLFEKGRILLEISSPMAVDQTSRVVVEGKGRETQILTPPPEWCFERQIRALVGELVGEHSSLTPGTDSLIDLAMIEQIWRCITA